MRIGNLYSIECLDEMLLNIEVPSRIETKKVTSSGKTREVIDQKKLDSNLAVALKYYQCLLKEFYFIKMPNRTAIMKEVISILPYINQYHNITVYKFDFKNFFLSLDKKKVNKIVEKSEKLLYQEELFLKKYIKSIDSFYPGIGIHNIFTELIGNDFDSTIRTTFKSMGLIYFSRYVDDCLMIFDETYDKLDIDNKIEKIMQNCFGKEMEMNPSKSQFHNCKSNLDIDYLGYNFKIDSSGKNIHLGISSEKIAKNMIEIERLIDEDIKNPNPLLLDYRLDAFYKRIVYYSGSTKKTSRWECRGISQNYKELRRFISNDTIKISDQTRSFLKGECINEIYNGKNRNPSKKIYNNIKNDKYYSSFLKNRAILLNPNIGLSRAEIIVIFEKLKLNFNRNDTYKTLVDIYMRKIGNMKNKP